VLSCIGGRDGWIGRCPWGDGRSFEIIYSCAKLHHKMIFGKFRAIATGKIPGWMGIISLKTGIIRRPLKVCATSGAGKKRLFLSFRLFATIVVCHPKAICNDSSTPVCFSTNELQAFLACCDARAQKGGFASWSDVHLESPLKRTIILECLKSCGLPVTIQEDIE
jgi:hypothetical protein